MMLRLVVLNVLVAGAAISQEPAKPDSVKRPVPTLPTVTTTAPRDERVIFEQKPNVSPGSSARVLVAAVDDNYYTYYHANVDPFAGAPPSRITGAIGVFGSIAPVRTRIYLSVH